MKHKLFIALFLSLFAVTYSVQAQSSSMKKLQSDLQQRKTHGTDLLAKAHQQQQQAKSERKESNTSLQQQAGSNTPNQARPQQPFLNTRNKKEDINQ
jgi:hypothetical protein